MLHSIAKLLKKSTLFLKTPRMHSTKVLKQLFRLGIENVLF